MTDRDLDFSGFQAERKVTVPPPRKKKSSAKKPKPKEEKADEPQEQSVRAQGKKAGGRASEVGTIAPGRKKRVNVSLPVDLSQRFTEKAAGEGRYLTDMVLDAYRNHFAALRDDHLTEQGDEDLPFRPRRRKTASGRVTHMLYLASPEIAVIDGSALEIGLSRSELVARLLERELG